MSASEPSNSRRNPTRKGDTGNELHWYAHGQIEQAIDASQLERWDCPQVRRRNGGSAGVRPGPYSQSRAIAMRLGPAILRSPLAPFRLASRELVWRLPAGCVRSSRSGSLGLTHGRNASALTASSALWNRLLVPSAAKTPRRSRACWARTDSSLARANWMCAA